jgi:predicted transport protein
MPLYIQKNSSLQVVKQEEFKLEKEIQEITEANLQLIFGLQFVTSEFALHNLRIDTLAFDVESNSFVIIEYKKDKNFSVIDQGYAYLSLMLNNKADFILEYNENSNQNLKRDGVDWSQSKVIFVSPSFSKYQEQATNFKDLPIQLWEISKYENNLIQYNQLQSPENSESITKISKFSEVIKTVNQEVKIYTEEDHLKSTNDYILELYKELKNQILNLGNQIEIQVKKYYIAFKASSNFVDINIQKNKIKLWLNVRRGDLQDPYNLSRDVSTTGHWGNGDYEITINSFDQITNIFPLIKQSYDLNKYPVFLLFNLINKLPEVFKSSKPEENNQILKFLISNSLQTGKKAELNLAKPFSFLYQNQQSQQWFGDRESNPDYQCQKLMSYH